MEDERAFHKKLIAFKAELEDGTRKDENNQRYAKYFDVKVTPARGMHVTAKQDVIEKAKKNYGYFALISNEIKDPLQALDLYRNKDLVEKAFDSVKNRLGFRRALVGSEQGLDGKLFVEFVALIVMSEIQRRMQEAKLFRKHTMLELLDQIDLIECYEQKGRALQYSEVLDKQAEIYQALGVQPPSW